MTPVDLARPLRRRGVWLAAMLLAAAALGGGWGPLQRLDLAAYDAIEPLFRPPGAPAASVIVAIDETSLASLGRWPWQRGIHADLVDRLHEAGVAAIAVSILFTEPAAGDERLAAAMARSGRVVLAVAPAAADDGPTGIVESRPTPELLDQVAALGHVDVEIDADALARRTFRRAGIGTPQWDALALATLRLARRQANHQIGATGRRAWWQAVAHAWVREGEMLLPYPDARSAPSAVSYARLLDQPALALQLQGKAAFVGTTASGLDGALTTPASSQGRAMAAVEFHARAYEALRSGQVYRSAPLGPTLALTLLFLALPTLLYPRLRSGAAIGAGALVLLPPLASGAALHLAQVWVAPAAATLAFAVGYVGWFARDLRRTRRFLNQVRRAADATLRSIADAVVTVDRDARIAYMNPVAERLTGQPLARVRHRRLGELLMTFTEGHALVDDALDACLQRRETVRLPDPLPWRTPDGATRALRLTASPLGDGADGAVLAFTDVTEALAATSKLEHDATHDSLTGLPNRTLLLDRLGHALAQAGRRRTMAALLFVDLDRFKRINDSLGHHAGDRVLETVAGRLKAAVRSGDTVARWGGDEFVVLMENLDDLLAVAAVARKVLELLAREVEAEPGTNLVLSCSIGIGIGPRDSTEAATLLLMADRAMYRVKLDGGGGFAFYSPDMNLRSRDQLKMESALRTALANSEFELHYQPQIDVAAGGLVGFEALIRWRRHDGQLVRPDAFIPAAEESGLIRSIGDWVIREAAAQAARWQAEGLPLVPLAVNVSAQQCADMSIVDAIGDALQRSSVAPGVLKIELTESTAMRDPERVARLLHEVDRLGVSVAVDDFGTGYSSLSLLKRFPISELKIDRSFVRDIARDGDDAAIVRGTIALAHGLGMTVVAEGVETESQLRFLASHRCDVAQGYLSAAPLPADEARAWLAALRPAPWDAAAPQ